MAGLIEDLITYADELSTKKDLEAGFKLITEIAGFIGIFGAGIALTSTVVSPLLGPAVAIPLMNRVMKEVARRYASMSTEERKQVRTAVNWVKRGCTLGDRLIDD